MTVRSVVVFHPRPGKDGQLLEAIKTVKKIIERNGGTLMVTRQVIGPQPGDVVAVAQYDDWNGFGKVRSDSELQQLLERMRNNPDPPADVVASAAYEEIEL